VTWEEVADILRPHIRKWSTGDNIDDLITTSLPGRHRHLATKAIPREHGYEASSSHARQPRHPTDAV